MSSITNIARHITYIGYYNRHQIGSLTFNENVKIYLSLQKSISVMMLSRGKRSVVEEAGVVAALDTLLGFIRHNSLGVKLVIY